MIELKTRVSVTIPDGLLRSINELTRRKRIKRSILLSEAVKLGFRELNIRFALEQYERGFMSVGRAAELAEISLAELLEEMRKRGLTPRYNLESLIKELSDDDRNTRSTCSDSTAKA